MAETRGENITFILGQTVEERVDSYGGRYQRKAYEKILILKRHWKRGYEKIRKGSRHHKKWYEKTLTGVDTR